MHTTLVNGASTMVVHQAVEDTEWWKRAKGQWRAKEQAVARWGWDKSVVQDKDKVDRDKVYDRG